MIKLNEVTKRFDRQGVSHLAVDSVTLSIDKGKIQGVIGQSGAGKSTLLRFINGLILVDAGQVWVDGQEVSRMNQRQFRTLRREVAMVFQSFNLLSNLSVEENIQLPLRLQPNEYALKLDQVLEMVGLSGKEKFYPSQLSGGQAQRVGLARALIQKPKILLLDEPTSALDEHTSQGIASVLRRINEELEVTMVLVTHQVSLAKALCHQVAIMEEGRLIRNIPLSPSQVHEPVKSYATFVEEVLRDGGV